MVRNNESSKRIEELKDYIDANREKIATLKNENRALIIEILSSAKPKKGKKA